MGQNDFTFGKAYKGNDNGGYAEALVKENAIKRNVVRGAQNMMELSAMALPRHERRRLAKINGISRIVGSNTPLRNATI